MKKIKKYTGTKTYMSPDGAIQDVESVLARFPAALMFTHIAELDEGEQVVFAVQNLSAMRGFYNIDPVLTEEEAIAAIELAVNAPPPEPEPSAEERIAAAMEFQNLMMI